MARVSLCVFCFYLDHLTLTKGHPDKGWVSETLWSRALVSQGVDAEAAVCRALGPSHRRLQLPPVQQVSSLSALVPKPQLPVSLKKIKKLKGSSRLQSGSQIYIQAVLLQPVSL